MLDKLIKEDKSKMFADMCDHLKLILGCVPGSRNSLRAGQVEDVFFTSRGERFGAKNSRSSVQVTSSVEEGVFWTSRGERFRAKNSKSAVQVTSFEEEGVLSTSRGERLVRENKFDRRSCDYDGGRYSERNKPYERPKVMENRKDENGKGIHWNFCSSTYHYTNGGQTFKAPKENELKDAQHETNLRQFKREVRNCTALDKYCTSSVAGEQ